VRVVSSNISEGMKKAHPEEADKDSSEKDQSADQDTLLRCFHILFLPLELELADHNRVTIFNPSFAEGFIHTDGGHDLLEAAQ